MLQMRCKSGMPAVVRPIGIQYAQLCFRRLPALFFEVRDYFTKVVFVHCQSPFAAKSGQLFVGHLSETRKAFHPADRGIKVVGQVIKVFLATFNRIDIIVANGIQLLVRHRLVKDKQAAALYCYVRHRVNEMDAING